MKTVIRASIILFLCICGHIHAQDLNVATFNLRNDNNKTDAANGDGWKDRYPIIAQMIRFHEFDVFGTQEGLHHQLEDLKRDLPGYDYTGLGRDDGKQAGEYSAIFYNTEKFLLEDHGDFWLSQQTDRPNKGWDAVLPRICSWAKLKLKENGKALYFFNVHFDHVGVVARSESAKLILQKVQELAHNQTAILTGDFNVDQQSPSYAVLTSTPILKDAFEVAAFKYATNGTFNNFNPNSKTESRIDHVFLTPDFKVRYYGVLTDTYRSKLHDKEEAYQSGNFPREVSLKDYRARTLSDHFPVMVKLTMP
ncbi:endonuclease/exonuclease/phosphatase family protein [Olivibacter sitiensis]|uniref:endonuclease/exonuclease/phosphatase family protein n=1 Tax=Olivibacter sitiensis TaxID=376470 RepID=UPI00041233FC|nr:endonuclease/exonuclease/phosphatase family protein [Olivibacter sitiensis]